MVGEIAYEAQNFLAPLLPTLLEANLVKKGMKLALREKQRHWRKFQITSPLDPEAMSPCLACGYVRFPQDSPHKCPLLPALAQIVCNINHKDSAGQNRNRRGPRGLMVKIEINWMSDMEITWCVDTQ